MTLKCMICKKPIKFLDPISSYITEGSVNGGWNIYLILACPCCKQKYNTFIPTGEFTLLDEDTE